MKLILRFIVQEKLKAYYKVKWEGYSDADCTFEPIENLDCLSIFEAFVEEYRQGREERKSKKAKEVDKSLQTRLTQWLTRLSSSEDSDRSNDEMEVEESKQRDAVRDRARAQERMSEQGSDSDEAEQFEEAAAPVEPAVESDEAPIPEEPASGADDEDEEEEFKSCEEEPQDNSAEAEMAEAANGSPAASSSAEEDDQNEAKEKEQDDDVEESASESPVPKKKTAAPSQPAVPALDAEALKAKSDEHFKRLEKEWCQESTSAAPPKKVIPNRLLESSTAPVVPPKRMFEWRIRYTSTSTKKRKISDEDAEDTDQLAEHSAAASKLSLKAISDKLTSNGISASGDEVFVRRRWLAWQYAQVEDYDVADIKTHFLKSKHTHKGNERRATFMLDNEHESLTQVDQLEVAKSVRRHKAGQGSIRHVILRLMLAVDKAGLEYLTSVVKDELVSLRLYMSALDLDEWALRDALIYTPNLEILELNTSCKPFTFAGVKSIISLLPNLRELDLWGHDLSDQAVRFIADHCPYLESLALCSSHLAEDTIRHLATRCPFIRVLCLDFIPHMTKSTMQHLFASLPQLKLLLLRNAGSSDSADSRARLQQFAKAQKNVVVVL